MVRRQWHDSKLLWGGSSDRAHSHRQTVWRCDKPALQASHHSATHEYSASRPTQLTAAASEAGWQKMLDGTRYWLADWLRHCAPCLYENLSFFCLFAAKHTLLVGYSIRGLKALAWFTNALLKRYWSFEGRTSWLFLHVESVLSSADELVHRALWCQRDSHIEFTRHTTGSYLCSYSCRCVGRYVTCSSSSS